jgi:hypothetical protein
MLGAQMKARRSEMNHLGESALFLLGGNGMKSAVDQENDAIRANSGS